MQGLTVALRRDGEIDVGANGEFGILEGHGRFVDRRPGLTDVDPLRLLADEDRDGFGASFRSLDGGSGLVAGRIRL